MKLSQRSIAALALPKGRTEAIFFDDEVPGFGLRLQGTSRRFVVQYKLGAKHRRMTLGSTTALGLTEARDSAKDILARVRLGKDPAGEKDAARKSATDRCETHMRSYLTFQKPKLRPSSYHRAERHFLNHWKPLHDVPITKIDRRTVAACLTDLVASCGPAAASRARAVLSAFFAWAMREGLVEANPVVATNQPYDNKGRERVLSGGEIARVWHAAGNDSYGTIVKLLILTGARREEIGGLSWSEIDFTARLIRLPPARVKNGRPHDVPLSGPALVLLRAMPETAGRNLVFGAGARGLGSYTIPKRMLDARVGGLMGPWCLHDLRRTCATHMAELGVQPHIVEAVLNHASGHKAGVAGVYNRSTYERDKRQALDLWAGHVMALVEGRPPNVVPLPPHGRAA
jgi:integrase